MYDVLIIGGGLAGLTTAIQLSHAGLSVLLLEKNVYPFHRVCGEYISNEVKPFLSSIGVEVEALNPSHLHYLTVTSPHGTKLEATLDMGAFGVSRYNLDFHLYKIALKNGCTTKLNVQVQEVLFMENFFIVKLSDGTEETARLVIGSFGKRSNLDRQLNRASFYKRSPYIGVKYHIKTDFPRNRIALHNFKDGYCGISAIEDDKYCLCYLTTRENLKKYSTIEELEKNILYKNPFLNYIFRNASFLYTRPEVINEIAFEEKTSVEKHLLMLGDTAGTIAPLCGNGMSMAIHSAKIASECILKHYHSSGFSRDKIETEYAHRWNATFSKRLFIGKKIQQLFGHEIITEATIRTLKILPPVTKWLIAQTHGKEF
ncbi:MAG TPA: NAD(P)/FAD-dependent oxidoreductase [Cytophagaceae bacterium]|jgi:flavin-dependent dehydrogenase|nr:NAD(P)/FAD-dependent oxidoreductase [Cytophagaceae bacterium]